MKSPIKNFLSAILILLTPVLLAQSCKVEPEASASERSFELLIPFLILNSIPTYSSINYNSAATISPDLEIYDELHQNGDYAVYRLSLTPGDIYRVVWDDDYSGSGIYSADITVTVVNSAHTSLADTVSGESFSYLDSGYYDRRYFITPTEGTIFIVVRNYGNYGSGTFKLYVETATRRSANLFAGITEDLLTAPINGASISDSFYPINPGPGTYTIEWSETGMYDQPIMVSLFEAKVPTDINPNFLLRNGNTSPGSVSLSNNGNYFVMASPYTGTEQTPSYSGFAIRMY